MEPNNPDDGPTEIPPRGAVGTLMGWVWWREGPWPSGYWRIMDLRDPDVLTSITANESQFPVEQDKALGEPSDFGNIVCHACEMLSDGYPGENRHRTTCNGVCRRTNCSIHHPLIPQTPGSVVRATVSYQSREGRRTFLRRPRGKFYGPPDWIAHQDVGDGQFFNDEDLRLVVVIYDAAEEDSSSVPL